LLEGKSIMREYAKVAPEFWIGQTGRALRGDKDAQIVALYLITGPSANMIGLYHIAIPTLAHETGLSEQGASKALQRVSKGGFCRYDSHSEEVFVPEMARFQIGETLKAGDNRIQGIKNELSKYRKSLFHNDFLNRYREAYHLESMPLSASPLEAPSKPLLSQEQEQEQEKEKREEKKEDAPLKLYGKFVKLTDAQYADLVRLFGEQGAQERIERLNLGIASKGYKYKDFHATILNWERNHKERPGKAAPLSENEQWEAAL
jgi:hypothetical protein